MEVPSECVSNNLEKSLQELLKNYQLEDILFILFCYAHKQAQKATPQDKPQEKIYWEKLMNLLDMSCNLVEEMKKKEDNDSSYLIY